MAARSEALSPAFDVGALHVSHHGWLVGWLRSRVRNEADNFNSLKMPSWTRLDLGARYAITLGGRPVVFRAAVDNVFDRNYWQDVFYSGSVNPGAPRIFRLSASVDF